jgi:hypothetical protein
MFCESVTIRATHDVIEDSLDTIGVHQMPVKNTEWDMESMVKFLQPEEIFFS